MPSAPVKSVEIFQIENTLDSRIVVYEARVQEHHLADPPVNVYWSDKKDRRKRSPVSSKAKSLWYGYKIRKSEKDKRVHYQMIVNAFPKKLLCLSVKTSGNVVAKGVVNGKQSKIKKIVVHMTKMLGLVPSVDSIEIHGVHKKRLIKEVMDVNGEDMKRFDLSTYVFS